ncbi:hypothetical protein MIR68_003732 [Amoeboaphelidium protococcarum]|nr:hypothetical protein MIR68_003732 [Amoeboaphelidium protococcarum]
MADKYYNGVAVTAPVAPRWQQQGKYISSSTSLDPSLISSAQSTGASWRKIARPCEQIQQYQSFSSSQVPDDYSGVKLSTPQMRMGDQDRASQSEVSVAGWSDDQRVWQQQSTVSNNGGTHQTQLFNRCESRSNGSSYIGDNQFDGGNIVHSQPTVVDKGYVQSIWSSHDEKEYLRRTRSSDISYNKHPHYSHNNHHQQSQQLSLQQNHHNYNHSMYNGSSVPDLTSCGSQFDDVKSIKSDLSSPAVRSDLSVRSIDGGGNGSMFSYYPQSEPDSTRKWIKVKQPELLPYQHWNKHLNAQIMPLGNPRHLKGKMQQNNGTNVGDRHGDDAQQLQQQQQFTGFIVGRQDYNNSNNSNNNYSNNVKGTRNYQHRYQHQQQQQRPQREYQY